MCEECEEAYRADMGTPLGAPAEFLARLQARAEIDSDLALAAGNMQLTENGHQVLMLGIDATVSALRDLMGEELITLTKGWLAMLGCEEAERRGFPRMRGHHGAQREGGLTDGPTT